jgi:CHAT domain
MLMRRTWKSPMRALRRVVTAARPAMCTRVVLCAGLGMLAVFGGLLPSRSQTVEPITLETATRQLTAAIQGNLGPSTQVTIGTIRLDRDAQGRTILHGEDVMVRDPAGGPVARLVALTAEQADGVLKVSLRGAVDDGRAFVKSLLRLSPEQLAQSSDLDLEARLDVFTGFNGEAMREVDLKLSRRAHGITGLTLSAKLGDAPLSIDLRRTTDGRDLAYLETTDAGALFRFGDLYQHIVGGRMWLAVAPPSAEPNPLDGTLNVSDFAIRDEPALQGLAAPPPTTPPAPRPGEKGARKGDAKKDLNPTARDVAFSQMRVNFTRTPDRLVVRDGVAKGPLVGATIEGSVDYASNEMRIRGTLVPLYGLNNALGQIPITGPFLSGDKEGVAGVAFEASGPSSAPALRVNPVSAMAPGVMRKLFDSSAPEPTFAPADRPIDRYPTIEAADRVSAGATTTVLVSLTVDKVTPEVKVLSTGEGTATTPQGALSIAMPADISHLPIRAVLRAPGFDLDPSTPEEATINLDRTGDSTSARFRITARPGEAGSRPLRVTFWRDNDFLAQVSRPIEIVAQPAAAAKPADTPSALLAAPTGAIKAVRASADDRLLFPVRPRPIDLKLEVVYDDPSRLGHGRVTVASDYLGNMRHGEINTSPELLAWIESFYRDLGQPENQAVQLPASDVDAARAARLGRLRAFGEELYRRAAPPSLQAALAELLGNPAVHLRTVQIYSNSPLIPWELMRAPKPDGSFTDFFGIAFALARWHEDDGLRPVLRPPQDQELDEVVAIAPSYSGARALGAQAREIDAIQQLLATRRVSGNRTEFLALARNPPSGIIHFAGHGEVEGRTPADRRFEIWLEDGPVDVMDWRGAGVNQGRTRALFFFNACKIGKAESIAGAVDGWAPAVLSRGAAGYIGGLWPLADDPAAQFAVAFYSAIKNRLATQGRASVAEALADARRLVYDSGDPTYLGYAFYGDAQLALVRR